MKYTKHTATVWRESIVQGKLVPYVSCYPTFENYIEASQAARMLSLAIGVTKVEVIHGDIEKAVEEWKCGCVEYTEE